MTKAKNLDPWIWGLHSVVACLECQPELIHEVYIEESKAQNAPLKKLVKALKEQWISVIEAKELPRAVRSHRNQGIAAKISHFPFWHFHKDQSKIEKIFASGGSYLLLDRVEDPRNYGAMLRSAAAFGIKYVFVAQKNQAPLTGTVAQVSAGNLFRLNVVFCQSLKKVFHLGREQSASFWGLSSGGEPLNLKEALVELSDEKGAVVWCLGSEKAGMRGSLLELCDRTIRLPMQNEVESLNVSTAAAIAMFLSYSRKK